MKISTAVEGFKLFMSAGNYSAQTIRLYHDNLFNLVRFLHDPEVDQVTGQDLQRFMVYMRTDYVPTRFSGSTRPISMFHLDNHWKAIRSFFRWANETIGIPRPDGKLSRPKFKPPEIKAFSAEEIKRIVQACEYTVAIKREGQQAYRMKRHTRLRDTALIMVLLDTGVRVGELCRMKIRDVDLAAGSILITPYETGQKTRPRTVYLGKAARRSLWLYLADREGYDQDEQLFWLTPGPVRALLKNIEARSGVQDVHPHRFRHSFGRS